MFRKGKHFCMLYHSSSYIIIMILKTAFSLLLKFAMTTMNQKSGRIKMSVSMCRECGTADAWLIIIILVIKIPQLTIYIYFWRFVLCYSGDQLCLPCRIVTWLKWLLIFIFFLAIMNVLFYCSFYECKFFFTLIVFVVWTWHSQMRI
jgi:hypothetical protein